MVMTMKESTMKNRVFVSHLNDRCLFKNLSLEEFTLIWEKLYTSYWKDEITYTEVHDQSIEDSTFYEHSY